MSGSPLAPSPRNTHPQHLKNRKRNKNKQRAYIHNSCEVSGMIPHPPPLKTKRCPDKSSSSIIHQTLVNSPSSCDCTWLQTSQRYNLQKDGTNPACFKDHQSPFVSSHIIPWSKAVLSFYGRHTIQNANKWLLAVLAIACIHFPGEHHGTYPRQHWVQSWGRPSLGYQSITGFIYTCTLWAIWGHSLSYLPVFGHRRKPEHDTGRICKLLLTSQAEPGFKPLHPRGTM